MHEILEFQCYLIYFYCTRILLCFLFLFLAMLNNFFVIPVAKENTRVKIALAIPAVAPVTVVKEIINTPSLVADKTIKVLGK